MATAFKPIHQKVAAICHERRKELACRSLAELIANHNSQKRKQYTLKYEISCTFGLWSMKSQANEHLTPNR